MPLEIERKFLVPQFPEAYRKAPRQAIQQGYLVVAETGDEVRIRKKDQSYTLTIKKGRGLQRQEIECAISKDQFLALWPATIGQQLQKTRYLLPQDIELDVYHGKLDHLIVAEVEFETLDQAKAFTPPNWFGLEITAFQAFKNQSLVNVQEVNALLKTLD
ncbi:MAG: CYTH domain-containing protein [Bacteroidota bacterium]